MKSSAGRSSVHKHFGETRIAPESIQPAFTFSHTARGSDMRDEVDINNVMQPTLPSETFHRRDDEKGEFRAETSPLNCSKQWTNYISTYFKFAYYMGVSPFRFHSDEKGNFHLKKWKPQQVICAFMSILSIFRLVTEIRLSFETRSSDLKPTPVEYFTNVMTIFTFVYKTTTLKRFWRNQKEYHKILIMSRMYANRYYETARNSWLVKPWVVHGVIAFFALQPFISLATGRSLISNSHFHFSLDLWIVKVLELARYSFFLDSNKLGYNNTSIAANITTADFFVGFVMALSLFQRFALGLFCDVCIFTCAITTWIHANNFATRIDQILKDDDFRSGSELKIHSIWRSVYQHFQAIQKVSYAVNQAVGSQTTLSLAESIIFYSLNLNIIMTVKNPFAIMNFVIFYLLNGTTFILAADIGSQLETVKEIITRDRNGLNIPTDEMNILLHEIVAKDIGIRGSNAFTITFPFLAAVLSTTVTIFIISVQSSERRGEIGTEDSYLVFSNQSLGHS